MTMDMNQKAKKMMVKNNLCLDGKCVSLEHDDTKLQCKLKRKEFWDTIPGYLEVNKKFIQCECYKKGDDDAKIGC